MRNVSPPLIISIYTLYICTKYIFFFFYNNGEKKTKNKAYSAHDDHALGYAARFFSQSRRRDVKIELRR